MNYLELINQFELRPIDSDEELDRAIKMVESLIDRPKLNKDEEDYLNVLALLIYDYEDEDEELEGFEALNYLMTENNLTVLDLANETGILAYTLFNILENKEKITIEIAKILAKRFSVRKSLFLGEKND